ncbi:MAG: NAD(P)/FAD-dependent oxidoreductase [Clostridia bacterium]|nr:NAD(P)/FAD-dependent oxidoreductase [Clostridia bacterium]
MIYDVAIIGAGVVGGLTARQLSRYKLSVCLIEAGCDVALGATKANSAIVHGGYDPVPGTLKAELNVKGTAMMEKLCEELEVHYKNNGSMVVAFDEEQLEHVKKLYQRGIANGVPGLSVISGDRAREIEPALSKNIAGALLCESSGIVCPYDLTIAAVGNAMDNGADLALGFKVVDIKDNGENYEICSDDGAKIQARYVVNSAGLYSDEVARMLGDEYHITAKKGEYMLLDKSEGGLVKKTIFQTPTKAGKGILVSPTVDGNLLVGPTSEKTDKGDKATTPGGLDTIKEKASMSADNINYRAVITSFTGLRASCDESDDFILEISKHSKRAINAVGIDSPGLSSSPAIAEYIAQLLSDAGLKLEENADFCGRRVNCKHFRTLSEAEKNEMIKKEPSYGRVICRCETVTEGEILEAIRQNPKATTIDGVKRRTRAGMGRCQGGFCMPFVTDIIAKELKIARCQVTKTGGKSRLLFGKTK